MQAALAPAALEAVEQGALDLFLVQVGPALPGPVMKGAASGMPSTLSGGPSASVRSPPPSLRYIDLGHNGLIGHPAPAALGSSLHVEAASVACDGCIMLRARRPRHVTLYMNKLR